MNLCCFCPLHVDFPLPVDYYGCTRWPNCCDECLSELETFDIVFLELASLYVDEMYGPHGPCGAYPATQPGSYQPQQYPFYQQQQQRYRSQLQLQQGQKRTLRKKASAWMSTPQVNIAPPPWQEQDWQSQNNVAVAQNAVLKECLSQGDLPMRPTRRDSVAESLHECLRRYETGDDDEDALIALAQQLSLDEAQPTPAPRSSPKGVRHKEDRSKGLFSVNKAWMYANSRLPPYVPPFKAYLETWQLFLRAATASGEAYNKPVAGERKDHIQADSRQGTKAMVLKTITMDDKKLIVIAIRGSQWNCRDWAVNFDNEPASPDGFLDDPGNACHAGFLQVARSMVMPVADRLRELLEQAPNRVEGTSLLFTGHSAGGAVASLLYMHMFSKKSNNPLSVFEGVFKRVHCITFGVPPVSLLPLQLPNERRNKKNMFVSFVNEGDPIVRADFAYMKSLVRLFATSAPKASTTSGLRQKMSRQVLRGGQNTQPASKPKPKPTAHAPIWELPDATLSNAGRVVVLRETPGKSNRVEAVSSSDEDLRGLVFGDPVMHHMDVYQKRIDALGVDAFHGGTGG